MSIRRLNYTKRKKLSRKHVRVQLEPGASTDASVAVLDLDLPPGLPLDARVFLEAYRTSPPARERFDLGTVSEARGQAVFRQTLTQFGPDTPTPLFRLKVTSVQGTAGRIVAEARSIQPVAPDEEQRQGLLYTYWTELKGPVWELEFESDRVLLAIDSRVDPTHDLPRRPVFKALVYPEILRRVLFEALIYDEHTIDDAESWQFYWARLPRVSFGFPDDIPDSTDARLEWINDAVRWCARSAELTKLMMPTEEA